MIILTIYYRIANYAENLLKFDEIKKYVAKNASYE